ncbi:MAG TPA: YihY/virulence factor BrkB family protein [Gemmatimonadales bacterium]|nr:YihY/virulence factor BrkB family protein [Gemmatimonadales bacterium]
MAVKDTLTLLKDSGKDFIDDDCPTQAAALSYYTIFSLPPLLLLILMILGAVLDPQDIQGQLETQMGSLMGPSATEQIRSILQQANAPGAGGFLPTVLSIGALILGATGAFGQLQAALNRAWEVAPDPQKGGLKAFLMKRVFSFGMILSVAFLLLVSLMLSAALTAFGGALGGMLPDGVSSTLLQVLNQVISFVVITALFAAIFKVLPDATVAWRDVWVGAAATGLLFVVGKFLIGLYLGRSNPGEAFGAAGSLAVMLVWIYYSSMILLFGAEFTQTWADRRGSGIAPEKGAVRVVQETKHVREGQQPVPA